MKLHKIQIAAYRHAYMGAAYMGGSPKLGYRYLAIFNWQ